MAAGVFASLHLALAACTFEASGLAGLGGDGTEPDAGEDPPDAAPPRPDAEVDAEPPPDSRPPDPAVHLLVTEVKAQPAGQEFIEIFNPLDHTVSLEGYFLSDDAQYALLPGAEGEVPVVNGDAIAGFPAGSTLNSGQVIVVAVDEQGFRAEFGRDADFVLEPATPPAAVEMVRVAYGNRAMDIIDTGEPIILFQWDGASDLVTDVDIVLVGNAAPEPGTDNGLPDKSGLEVDGPDAGDEESRYAQDAADMRSMSFRAAGSYQRIALEGDREGSGGNGVEGHDETSEDTRETWAQQNAAPTPGEVPTALLP